MKRKKQFFRKIILLIISLLLSIIIAMISINYYLKFTNKGKESQFIDWTIESTRYNLLNVYWRFSFCRTYKNECKFFEERLVPHQVALFNQKSDLNDCKTILFLGDSFTDAPWTEDNNRYSYLFSKKLSMINDECIKEVRVSTGGTGTSQQFAEFQKIIKFINPDMVIWQFCENDIYENVKTSVHKIKNEKLSFSSAISNFQFWAGFLNQKIPFLKGTTLGKHLMYLGEKKDVLRNWPVSFNDGKGVKNYNQILIPLLINKMKELSNEKNFKLITTISPLECNFINERRCFNSRQNHLFIEDILKNNSEFISMETRNYNQEEIINFTPNKDFYIEMFNTTEDTGLVGHRHLSELGNNYFGEILFENYLNKISN